MYKFEISADSFDELQTKMKEFANELLTCEPPEVPEYVDDQPNLPKFEEVPESFAPPLEPPKVSIPTLTLKEFDPGITTNAVVEKVAIPAIGLTASLDSKGMPYDIRIHSSAKTQNKDGTWRYKKGLADEFIQSIERANRVCMLPDPIISQPLPPPPAPTVAVEMPSQTPPVVEAPKVQATPVAQAASYENIPTPQGVRAAHSLATFKTGLTLLIANLINEKKIDVAYVGQIKAYFGVKEIWNVLDNPVQTEELYNQFASLGFITKVDL